MKKINLLAECAGASRIGISAHIRPDGDAVGSCMALYHYLRKGVPEAQVRVFLEPPSEVFRELTGQGVVEHSFPGEPPFDVFFALDTAKERLGGAEKYFDEAAKRINIDHHISNSLGCGDVNVVEPEASSTAEVLYEQLDQELLDEEIAKALYIGVIHDSGVFQYSNTSPRTMEIGADLIRYGFDFSRLIEETFYQKSYMQSQLLGRALLDSTRYLEDRCIVSSLSLDILEYYGAKPSDLEGIVNQLRNVKGVDCAVFLYETEQLEYKASLRSNEKVDVAKVAAVFGGGGHVRAAGCSVQGHPSEVADRLLAEIGKQLCR